MPDDGGAELARRDVDIEADSLAMRGSDRGKKLAKAAGLGLSDRLGQLSVILGLASHRIENAGLGFQAELLKFAPVVVIRLADAAQPG